MDTLIPLPLAVAIAILALFAGLISRRLLRAAFRLAERYLLPARHLAYRGTRTRTDVRGVAAKASTDT